MASITPYTFIEVCAGAGGLSSGLVKAGFHPLLLNDNNKDCCSTLTHNHPDTEVICGSMLDLDLEPYRGKVDILTGGVPCQAFSQAGNRKGFVDPRGDLILKFVDLIIRVQPKLFLIENVKGLLTHDQGRSLALVLETLSADGLYSVVHRVLNSADYGVAQKRERVFIVGTLKSIPLSYSYPLPAKTPPKLLKDVLPNCPESKGAKYSDVKLELFKLIPQGGCWVNLPIDLQRSYLGKSFESGGGKRGILRRLSMEEPSLTILCSPSQKQTERCHPLEDRPLTIRESARIQSFDDDYEFIGSLSSQYKQIGNAVPVELARYIGLSIKDWLDASQ